MNIVMDDPRQQRRGMDQFEHTDSYSFLTSSQSYSGPKIHPREEDSLDANDLESGVRKKA